MGTPRVLLSASFVAAAACALSGTCPAQANVSPAAAFAAARTLYDTPADKGLEGFDCTVTFDWRQFIEKANHAPVAGDDARLRYLEAIKLSISDDLNGAGALHWSAPTTAPDGSEDSVAQMRTGMQALIAGFFQSWNGFATGDLVTLDRAANIERTSAGYHLFTRSPGGQVAEEVFDNDFTMKSLHVSTMQYDSLLTPTFTTTAQGRVVSELTSVFRQPPTSAGTTIHMGVHYATVNGFQLPSELTITAAGAASFDFQLSGCTVRMRVSSADAPAHP